MSKDLVARAMRPCGTCGLLFLPQAVSARRCDDCRKAGRERPLRRARSEPRPKPEPARRKAQCVICRATFTANAASSFRKTCSPGCAAKHQRALSNARKRNREHAERAGSSDITNAQELAMRRRARKCPLCGVFLTGKPGLPNSKHLDHIVPLGVGGTHTHGNVRIICRTCNVRRPRDGSDYTGPLTLWAAVPGVVSR